MPKPNPIRGRDDADAEAAQKARGVSGVGVETVAARPRRRYSAAEKIRILKAAETALASGERGALEALLRREGIYSSHLSAWRQQFAARGRGGLAPSTPGRKPKLSATERELLASRKRNAQLEQKLKVAHAIIELQKKAHAVLGIALPALDEEDA